MDISFRDNRAKLSQSCCWWGRVRETRQNSQSRDLCSFRKKMRFVSSKLGIQLNDKLDLLAPETDCFARKLSTLIRSVKLPDCFRLRHLKLRTVMQLFLLLIYFWHSFYFFPFALSASCSYNLPFPLFFLFLLTLLSTLPPLLPSFCPLFFFLPSFSLLFVHLLLALRSPPFPFLFPPPPLHLLHPTTLYSSLLSSSLSYSASFSSPYPTLPPLSSLVYLFYLPPLLSSSSSIFLLFFLFYLPPLLSSSSSIFLLPSLFPPFLSSSLSSSFLFFYLL